MRFLAAALLMCSVSAPALAQVSQDTLAEAVDSAVGNNPELMAQRKIRAFADENLNQAEAQMGPQVNLNGTTNLLSAFRRCNTERIAPLSRRWIVRRI